MQERAEKEKIDDFIQTCQGYQLKITPQRVAIYKELLNSEKHPTADALFQSVKMKYPNISFDTVNRTLLTLAEIGILDIVEGYGGAKRFDTNVEDHHHLHCIRCGIIQDFINEDYDHIDVPEEILNDFQVVRKRVVLKGICSKCRK
jgi:Fur family peroxide stress response transcriptional regulator